MGQTTVEGVEPVWSWLRGTTQSLGMGTHLHVHAQPAETAAALFPKLRLQSLSVFVASG